MNEKELKDFDQILNCVKNFVKTKLNRTVRLAYMYKSRDTNKLYMACEKYLCNFSIVLSMNLNTKEIHLLYKPLCEHAVLNGNFFVLNKKFYLVI